MRILIAILFMLPGLLMAESVIGNVYKSPTCGCCNAWIDHMNNSGFNLQGNNVDELMQLKQRLGIVPAAQSCHSAVINSFVFEGHVPAEVVRHFLNAPIEDALGLSVPGMPVGSPGMEMGDRHDDFVVQALMIDGSMKPFANVTNSGIVFIGE